MAWKVNRKLVSLGFNDLERVPRERCGWDMTLACLAFAIRMDVERAAPDLNEWAARHGLPASARYQQLADDALVLWHGTSRERAEKIKDHGLFHKKGLWAALHPAIPHSFCRGRSEEYATGGAVVCIVLDRTGLYEGLDFDIEPNDNVYRFHHRLPADVVEYVLLHERMLFTGGKRARTPVPWPSAKFKKKDGRWVPVQKPPVRYSDAQSYSTRLEFARICVDRLVEELEEVTALEVFSSIYSNLTPWDVLAHEDVLALMDEMLLPFRRRSKWQVFRARKDGEAGARQ